MAALVSTKTILGCCLLWLSVVSCKTISNKLYIATGSNVTDEDIITRAPPDCWYGYHDNIGIPRAAEIKAEEDRYFKERRNAKSEKIVGGSIAPPSAYPYLAGLLIDLTSGGRSVCGSSLVSPHALVTAAHCWNDGYKRGWRVEVILGSNHLYYGGTRIHTSAVVVHPRWNRISMANDIAMIKLPINVRFPRAALPSPYQFRNSFVERWAVAAGFGATRAGQLSAATIISHVNLRVMPVAQCAQFFPRGIVTYHNICTSGAGGVGICGGDSGGPLVLIEGDRHVLIGISSFGAQNCQAGYPSSFTRVTSHLNFITSML